MWSIPRHGPHQRDTKNYNPLTYPLEIVAGLLLTLDDIKDKRQRYSPQLPLLEERDLENWVDEVWDKLSFMTAQLVPHEDHLLAHLHTGISEPEGILSHVQMDIPITM